MSFVEVLSVLVTYGTWIDGIAFVTVVAAFVWQWTIGARVPAWHAVGIIVLASTIGLWRDWAGRTSDVRALMLRQLIETPEIGLLQPARWTGIALTLLVPYLIVWTVLYYGVFHGSHAMWGDEVAPSTGEPKGDADAVTKSQAWECRTRGMRFLRNGEIDAAVAEFTDAIALDPGSARAYCNRGLAYLEGNHLDEAIEDFTEAVRLDPKCAAAFGQRANASERKGDTEAAEADRATAKRLAPTLASGNPEA